MPLFLGARVLSELATLVQSVAVGWQLYAITHQPMALGLAGLAQFIPIFILTLPAGELCDRVGPKRVLAASMALDGVCGGIFLWLTVSGIRTAWPFFATLALFGVARSLYEPAVQSTLPFLVPRETLPRSIALNSSLMEAAGLGASTIVFGLGSNQRLHSRFATQLATPDSMRGRVNAVYMVFVGASKVVPGDPQHRFNG